MSEICAMQGHYWTGPHLIECDDGQEIEILHCGCGAVQIVNDECRCFGCGSVNGAGCTTGHCAAI